MAWSPVIRVVKFVAFVPFLLSAAEFHGYAKFHPIITRTEDSSAVAVQSRIRAELNLPSNRWQFNAAYELSPTLNYPRPSISFVWQQSQPHSRYRLVDIDRLLYPRHSDSINYYSLTHNFDKIALTYSGDKGSITAGRQTVGWGAARSINPTDVLTPLGFGEILKEERVGIDALVMRRSLGSTGETEAGIVAGKGLVKGGNAAFFRLKGTGVIGDFSSVAILFCNNLLLGGEWESSFKQSGVRIELASVFPDVVSANGNSAYVRMTGGVDRQFHEKVYLYLEYSGNSAGATNGEMPLNSRAFEEGAIRIPGKHYLAGGGAHQLLPLWNISESVLIDLNCGHSVVTVQSVVDFPRNDRFSFDCGSAAFVKDSSVSLSLFGGIRFYW